MITLKNIKDLNKDGFTVIKNFIKKKILKIYLIN